MSVVDPQGGLMWTVETVGSLIAVTCRWAVLGAFNEIKISFGYQPNTPTVINRIPMCTAELAQSHKHIGRVTPTDMHF